MWGCYCFPSCSGVNHYRVFVTALGYEISRSPSRPVLGSGKWRRKLLNQEVKKEIISRYHLNIITLLRSVNKVLTHPQSPRSLRETLTGVRTGYNWSGCVCSVVASLWLEYIFCFLYAERQDCHWIVGFVLLVSAYMISAGSHGTHM